MPLYEYQCVKCGHRFEKIEAFTAPLRQKCSKCRGRAERLLTAPAIQFKGSGWYVTDYAGKAGQDSSADKAESVDAKATTDKKESKEPKEKKEPPAGGHAKKPRRHK